MMAPPPPLLVCPSNEGIAHECELFAAVLGYFHAIDLGGNYAREFEGRKREENLSGRSYTAGVPGCFEHPVNYILEGIRDTHALVRRRDAFTKVTPTFRWWILKGYDATRCLNLSKVEQECSAAEKNTPRRAVNACFVVTEECCSIWGQPEFCAI